MKASTRHLIIGMVIALIATGIAVGYYLYNKPHENIMHAKAAHALQATRLAAEFEADEQAANEQYLGKVLEVSGQVANTAVDSDGLVTITFVSDNPLSGVICELDIHSSHPRVDFDENELITVKGICTGYLMDVVMTRCVEIQ